MKTADEVRAWVETVIASGSGRTDAILLANAMDRSSDLNALGDVARALAGSAERWRETSDQGAALAQTLHSLGHGDGIARPYPVTLGAAARDLDLEKPAIIALYLQAFAAMLVSAAVRFVPLGQVAGQQILSDLHPVLHRVAGEAATAGLDQIGQSSFGAELAAMEHETLEVRIFRT